MKIIRLITVFIILTAVIGTGCQESEDSYPKQYPGYQCRATEPIARSINTDCNIQFWDIMFKYTYVKLESYFYTVGAPCNESVFRIKYINSKHDHCEPDYTFTLKMNAMTRDEFFKPGSIQINKLDIYEESLCGGIGGPASNVDITLIWDEVSLVGSVYSGKGRFIINKDIPSSFPGYKYPAQEIPFEFHARDRERN
ncbi:MAG: hypothetical protein Q8S54_09995 [Bacteroidota bacterium]|nr:hypothetical protein [Bacteroidota bacterium]